MPVKIFISSSLPDLATSGFSNLENAVMNDSTNDRSSCASCGTFAPSGFGAGVGAAGIGNSGSFATGVGAGAGSIGFTGSIWSATGAGAFFVLFGRPGFLFSGAGDGAGGVATGAGPTKAVG